MCHPDAVQVDVPGVTRTEVHVPLITGEQLPASCCSPERGHGPPVLVIPDIHGRTSFYAHVTARLAAEGYVALLPDYFFRQGELHEATRQAAFARWDSLDEPGALGDLETAVHWLQTLPEVTGRKTGLVGFCLGGTLALDLCARLNNLVTVCYYAFPETRSGPNTAPKPRDLVGDLRGPILSFWGDADYIDLGEIHDFSAAVSAAGVAYEHEVYPGAGHGFLQGLLEERSDTRAAEDSWERALRFLAKSLTRAAGQ